MRRSRPNWFAQGYFWLVDRLYNELAWIYDPVSWFVSLGHWAIWRKWALDYCVGSRVLEVGFGTGELLLELARGDYQVMGLDCSAAMQRLVKNKLRHHGLWVPRIHGITQQMPFADESFDTIIATFPAGYIFDPETWREVARLLRKPDASTEACGGRFIVVGICYSSTSKLNLRIIPFLFGLPMEEILGHFKLLAGSVNLDLQVVMHEDGKLNLPILIAKK